MSTKKKNTKASTVESAADTTPKQTTAKPAAGKKTASKKSARGKQAAVTTATREQAPDTSMHQAADAASKAAPAALEEAAMTPPAPSSGVSVAVQEPARVPAEKKPAAAPVVKEPAAPPAPRPQTPPAVATAPGGTPAAPKKEQNAHPRPQGNPYLPEIATVMDVIEETHNIKTLRVVLDDPEKMRAFAYNPGQVGQLSVFGVGEATFVINSPPSQKEYLQFSVMRAGEVTTAIHKLAPGDKVGVRAPLGNSFPYEDWKGKNVIFVGGGIGMAPIRTIMLHLLDHRQDYGNISLLYGARSPLDMSFSYELDGWMRRPDLNCTLTIDAPFEGWEHRVGLIPHVLLDMGIIPDNTVAVLCGPPIMIKFTVEALKKLEFPDEAIITTLEKRMKCGIGICGRCNIGDKYVCVDGPVFSWAQLKNLPPEL